MIIQHLNSKSPELDQWDQFIMSSPRGHYCQLSTWLKSFKVYGITFHVIVIKDGEAGQIIGGMGLLELGRRPFKLVTLPMGPIVEVGFEEAFPLLISEALSYSKTVGAFLFQLKVPHTEKFTDAAILPTINMPIHESHGYGFPFSFSSIPNEMLWIDYEDSVSYDEWESKIYSRCKKHTRRDIRRSERNGLTVCEVTEVSDLKKAYSLIEQNGREKGYATRSWEDFGPTLIDQIKNGHAIMLAASHSGQFLGAHYAVLAGKRWSYLMGGTVRAEKDYLVGHFIHWQALKKAWSIGLRGYDFTSRGSQGVQDFKMGFGPTHVQFGSPHYYILSRPWFAVWRTLYPTLRKYRTNLAPYAKLFSRNGK